MKILNDHKIKEAFEEYENSFIIQEQDDFEAWEKIQSQLLIRKAFRRKLLYSAAAMFLLLLLFCWFFSFKILSEENAQLQKYNTQLKKDLEKEFALRNMMPQSIVQ
jgi:hypothetical protein